MRYELHLGDNREVLRSMPSDSVDSIVSDPPYELGFMGKKWDSTGIAYDVTLWAECLRVLKPGGHLLAFGGSRTYHRLAVAIEDAGFEIRDCIMWLYGSGFPKSHNVANAIDKSLGHGNRGHAIASGSKFHPTTGLPRANGEQLDKYKAKTELSIPYEGWGTALKPATENIIMAYKPHGTEHGIIIANLQKLEVQLWLMQYACSAEWSSTSSPSELGVALSIAQWTVAELISTRDDLLGQMDTLQLSEMANMCLSIVQSWKNTWGEASKLGNTFITETVLSPIIGWTTLKSSLSHLTLNFIIREWTQHDTEWLNALSAASPFIVASKKLKSTLELIAVESAISRTSNPADIDARITVEPIVVARKPLQGTVADNVQAWGVGALNIDGCRVGGDAGRWPANIILDEEAAQMLDEQSGERKSAGLYRNIKTVETQSIVYQENMPWTYKNTYANETGGASRFFYVAKASKAEREAGLEGMEVKQMDESRQEGNPGGDNPRNRGVQKRANHHPTVKPIALMRYLVRMVTPRGGVVLDPFMGSGTTGCAAMLEGMNFIGIDITPEYKEIAERRIQYWASQNPMGLSS